MNSQRTASLVQVVLGAALACSLMAHARADEAQPAQTEFVPKDGKGRVVIVISGHTGPSNYSYIAHDLAGQGFYAVLVDGNDFFGTSIPGERRLRELIDRAQHSEHALPGKVGVVGFSLGGGAALTYASRMPDLVAAVATAYPYTKHAVDPAGFVGKMKVPVLLMAGGRDTYKDCCRIEKARALDEAAKAAEGVKLELVVYPDAEHGWSITSQKSFRSGDNADSFKRTVAHLKANLGD